MWPIGASLRDRAGVGRGHDNILMQAWLYATKGGKQMNNGLHSLSSGEGPPVILLHGLFGQGSNMRGVARALESNFAVHCLDLPDLHIV